MKWNSYLQLMRFHKPAGILLLWWPTASALWIANHGRPAWNTLLLFLTGTILMRAAGCVMNDIADRKIDCHVKRTQLRPLTSGKVSLIEALMIFLFLLLCAALILFQLPLLCFYFALLALFISILYPFCKRFIQAPQVVLGIAFSMGIPMAFAAANFFPLRYLLLLFFINFLWIVAYDTQYAMADREDDIRIGVKSTAVLFAKNDRLIIGIFQILFHSLWLLLGLDLGYSTGFIICWLFAGLILFYQQKLIEQRDPKNCLAAFNTNIWYGALIWLGIIWSN